MIVIDIIFIPDEELDELEIIDTIIYYNAKRYKVISGSGKGIYVKELIANEQ